MRQTFDSFFTSSNSRGGGWATKPSATPQPATTTITGPLPTSDATNNITTTATASGERPLSAVLLAFNHHQAHSRKRKTSLLSGGSGSESGNKQKNKGASGAKGKSRFSLGHVIFHDEKKKQKKQDIIQSRSLLLPPSGVGTSGGSGSRNL